MVLPTPMAASANGRTGVPVPTVDAVATGVLAVVVGLTVMVAAALGVAFGAAVGPGVVVGTPVPAGVWLVGAVVTDVDTVALDVPVRVAGGVVPETAGVALAAAGVLVVRVVAVAGAVAVGGGVAVASGGAPEVGLL